VTPWPRTIHARLTLGYAVAFFNGLIVFAVISFASLDGALKSIIDARLQNAMHSVAAVVFADPAVKHPTRERLDLVTGSNMSDVVLSADGRAVYSGTPEVMAGYARRARALGADIIGACCGSTPDHIRVFRTAIDQWSKK